MAWIERVPSQSNPSDMLSREFIRTFMNCAHTEVDVSAVAHVPTGEVKTPFLTEGSCAIASMIRASCPEVKRRAH